MLAGRHLSEKEKRKGIIGTSPLPKEIILVLSAKLFINDIYRPRSDMIQIVIFCHPSGTTSFVGFIIGTAKEGFCFIFSPFDDEVAIAAAITFQNWQYAPTQVIGHKVAQFRLVSTDP